MARQQLVKRTHILAYNPKKGKAHAIVGLPYKSNCAESLHNLIVATVSLSNTRST